MTGAEPQRARLAGQWRQDATVVSTPLDMISQLERAVDPISTVVLAGEFAANRELAAFLVEFYPMIGIVDGTDPSTDPYLPAFA